MNATCENLRCSSTYDYLGQQNWANLDYYRVYPTLPIRINNSLTHQNSYDGRTLIAKAMGAIVYTSELSFWKHKA